MPPHGSETEMEDPYRSLSSMHAPTARHCYYLVLLLHPYDVHSPR